MAGSARDGTRYWVETLGCPKNQVDSDKLVGTLVADGMRAADSAAEADLVVVNTCAFIEDARQESIDTILALDDARSASAELVVTGCMAERYGTELAEALPEVDAVRGFGVPVTLGSKPDPVPAFDLLNLPRPAATEPWAYVKVAEGCDRKCGFCAIPSFRGPQRSRTIEAILDEVDELDPREIVLVAQDLASFGRDQGQGERQVAELVAAVAERTEWVRLLYLYPSDLTDAWSNRCSPPACRTSTSACSTCPDPWCGRCVVGAMAIVSSTAYPTSGTKSPTPPSGRTSSSGTPARPRSTRPNWSSSSKRPNSTGVGSSPIRPRSAPTQPSSMAKCRSGWCTSGWPS